MLIEDIIRDTMLQCLIYIINVSSRSLAAFLIAQIISISDRFQIAFISTYVYPRFSVENIQKWAFSLDERFLVFFSFNIFLRFFGKFAILDGLTAYSCPFIKSHKGLGPLVTLSILFQVKKHFRPLKTTEKEITEGPLEEASTELCYAGICIRIFSVYDNLGHLKF